MVAKVSITVCDKCRKPGKPTKRYRVAREGASATLDLCHDDAKGLEELLATHGRAATRRTFDASVKTIDEIEAAKRASARPPGSQTLPE